MSSGSIRFLVIGGKAGLAGGTTNLRIVDSLSLNFRSALIISYLVAKGRLNPSWLLRGIHRDILNLIIYASCEAQRAVKARHCRVPRFSCYLNVQVNLIRQPCTKYTFPPDIHTVEAHRWSKPIAVFAFAPWLALVKKPSTI